MDLRQIRYFVATAEAGSMLVAARRLHVAQPALSRRLRDLEFALGAGLLDRHSRGIRLTEEGLRFLGHAREILTACARAEAAFPISSVATTPRLVFGVTPTPATLLMPQIVAGCAALEPKIALLVRQGSTPELRALITSRVADGILTYAARHGRGVDVHPLYREDLVLIARADSRRETGDIRFADLATLPLILDPHTHVTRAVIEAAADATRISLDVRAEIEPLPIKRQMLMTQDVATIAIAGAFAPEIAVGALIARRIVAPTLPMTLHLVLQRTLAEPIRTAFVRLMSDAVADVLVSRQHGWLAIRS